tara:strand:+ start:13070 stop:13903 length:834 start_codon:yes stop_codon:yes gene_type:complete
MSVRNNADRTAAPVPADTPVTQTADTGFSFTTPTEFVDLPSGGKLYPEGHVLHNVDSVEIRYMTAKDEDILTSSSLLKKGIAVDRMLENILTNKSIKVDDLLIGDKNALILAARVTGYGADYTTAIVCPVCGEKNNHEFDLSSLKVKEVEIDVNLSSEGNFLITLPKSNVQAGVRLLTGKDEKDLAAQAETRKKHNLEEATLTDQFKKVICSVNGNTDTDTVAQFVNNMPAADSRYLRGVYTDLMPNIDMNQNFNCTSCGFEEEVSVPFTADFFWPK